MKRRGLVCLFLVFAVSRIYAGTFTTTDTLIRVPASASATDAGDTTTNTSNTIHLDARVYIPDGVTAPAPVVVIIHGYGSSKTTGEVVTTAQDFASNGYVVLTPTLRGFGNSEGLVTLGGPNEINDLKTIILDMQTGTIGDTPAVPIPVNSNSKFGMTGVSYGGGHSFEIMRTHVAGLAAVAPVIGWTDLYQALVPNNVPKLGYALALFGGGFDKNNPNYDDVLFNWAADLLTGNPQNTRTGTPQQNIDWRSVIFDPAQLTVPTFVIQGWQDWLFPPEQATSLFQANTAIPFFKLYIGGLGHPPATSDITVPEGVYLRAQLVRWFDHWLKNIDNGITAEPRVTIAPERTGIWSEASLVTSDTFPLPGTTSKTFFINGSNLLPTAPGKGKVVSLKATKPFPAILQPLQNAIGSNFTTLIEAIITANSGINAGGDIVSPSLVTDMDKGANALTFVSKPLTQDMHVVGLPDFHLWVSAGASNAYYYVELIERTSSGTDRFVTRTAFKDTSNSFASPHEIDFSGFGINRVFNSGNRIGLRIASRDFPFFYVNPNQPSVKFYRNGGHSTNVVLPVAP